MIRRPHNATYPDPKLTKAQMMSVLRNPGGGISYEQLHTYIDVQRRTVRGWVEEAGLLKLSPQRLTNHVFTSGEILHQLAPWLRQHIRTPKASEFIATLVVEKLMQL